MKCVYNSNVDDKVCLHGTAKGVEGRSAASMLRGPDLRAYPRPVYRVSSPNTDTAKHTTVPHSDALL